jgi:hypothetical protein
MALDTTVGGENTVSYVSVSESNSYFANHFSLAKTALWDALSQPRKESALKKACQQLETIKFLDVEFAFAGRLPLALIDDIYADITISKHEEFQRLQFPRNIDEDSAGDMFVPQEVKDAQCEQAVHLLNFDDAALLTIGQGVVEEAVTAGPVKSYTRYSEHAHLSYLSPMAIELLRQFMRTSSRVRRS